jgi:hypothetical protein
VAGLLANELMPTASLDTKEVMLRLTVCTGVVNEGSVLAISADSETNVGRLDALAAWKSDDESIVRAEDKDPGNWTDPDSSTEICGVTLASSICTDGVVGGRVGACSVDIGLTSNRFDDSDAWNGAAASVTEADDPRLDRSAGLGTSERSAGERRSLTGDAVVRRRLDSDALDCSASATTVPVTDSSEDSVRDKADSGRKEMKTDWSETCELETDAIGKKTPGDPDLETEDRAAVGTGSFGVEASFLNFFT